MSEKSVEDRLKELEASQELANTLREQAKYKKEIAAMGPEELQAAQSLYATNASNNLMLAEMLSRTGKMKDAAEARIRAEKEHMRAVEAFQAAAYSMEEQILAVKKAKQALEDAEKAGIPEKIALAEATLAAAQKELEVHEKRMNTFEEEKDNMEKRLAILKETTSAYEDLTELGKEAYDETREAAEGVAEALFGVIDYQKTSIGRAAVFAQKLMAGEGAARGMALALKDVLHPANIGAMLFTKVAESFMFMFFAVDKAAASLAKATGTGREYVGLIEDSVKQGNRLGVNFENAGKAFEGLFEELIGFVAMDGQMMQALTTQVAGFERLGIASTDVADMMNTFSKTMGTSAQASVDLTRKIAMMGSTIGVSSKKMIKNFQLANKTLAVYGKGSIKVFSNLTAAAKAAGVEMSALLGVAEKFDTFESAADSVGKLNALLGSQLSSTKMLMMTEDERIETVIQQINASGQTFAQMDRFKQKAIANAVGITDMAEANRLFGMSMSQYREHGRQMKEAETSQRKMEEALKATVPITEMFQQMIIEFAPKVTPALESVRFGIQTIIDGLAFLNKISGGTFPYIIAVGGLITLLFTVLSVPIKGIAMASKAAGKGLGVMGKGMASTSKSGKGFGLTMKHIGGAIRSVGKGGLKAAAVFLSMGAAALMMGAGVALAAYGVAQLVMAFAGLGGAQMFAAVLVVGLLTYAFVAFFGVMAAALATGVAPATAGVLLAMGFAALMLGAGIALAALGVVKMIEALGGLGVKAIYVGAAFLMISAGIAMMAYSIAAIIAPLAGFAATALMAAGPTAAFAGAALMLGVGILILGAGLYMVGEMLPIIVDGIKSLSEMSTGAVAVIGGLGTAFGAMALGLAAMFAFISNPLGWLAIGGAMAVMASGVGLLVAGIDSINEEKLKGVAQLSTAIAQLTGQEIETTIIGKVNQDLQDFKSTMDSNMQTQIAALNTFNDVRAINETRAETQIQQQIVLPPVNVNLKTEATTNIGDTKFAEHVHEATKQIKWKNSAGAESIYLAGYEKAVGG